MSFTSGMSIFAVFFISRSKSSLSWFFVKTSCNIRASGMRSALCGFLTGVESSRASAAAAELRLAPAFPPCSGNSSLDAVPFLTASFSFLDDSPRKPCSKLLFDSRSASTAKKLFSASIAISSLWKRLGVPNANHDIADRIGSTINEISMTDKISETTESSALVLKSSSNITFITPKLDRVVRVVGFAIETNLTNNSNMRTERSHEIGPRFVGFDDLASAGLFSVDA
mmetsp:Transcript_8291/g.14757  ORF Transcript_8291/g.14757 Transcript_8291/m.14757 type:complete len:227 (-) Transcript_8291:1721-2401(-)